MISAITSINTLVQTLVDEDKRGRVMSLYAMALMGMNPFGNLLAGTLAEKWSLTGSVALFAVITGVFALVIFFKIPRLRQMT